MNILLSLLLLFFLTPSSPLITSLIKLSAYNAFKAVTNRELGMIHLRPNPYNIPNVSIVLWHGYGIAPTNYRQFAQHIQQYGSMRDLSIEVFIPKHYTIPSQIYAKNVYLFGHSSGGYDALRCNNPIVNATMVYGASHNTKQRLYYGFGKIPKIPLKQTLTIFGEKDGYLSYMNILDEFCDNATHKAIVLSATNHLCISNNQTNIFTKILNVHDKYHIPLPLEIASNRVASVFVDYILYTMGKDPYFLKYVQNTRERIAVIERLMKLDKVVLPIMVSLSLKLSTATMDKYKNFFMFLLSKPNDGRGKVYMDERTVWVKLCNSEQPKQPEHVEIVRIQHLYNSILNFQDINVTNVSFHTCATSLGWVRNKPGIAMMGKNKRDVSITIERFLFRDYVYLKVPKIMAIYNE